jgi:hypothetical protein
MLAIETPLTVPVLFGMVGPPEVMGRGCVKENFTWTVPPAVMLSLNAFTSAKPAGVTPVPPPPPPVPPAPPPPVPPFWAEAAVQINSATQSLLFFILFVSFCLSCQRGQLFSA